MIAALREAAIAAAVAFGLFVLLVGLKTEPGSAGTLILRERFGDVALLCGLVFTGRLLMALWRARRAAVEPGAPTRLAALTGRLGPWLAPALLATALLLPWLPGIGRSELDLGILVLTYVMLGWGLNIVVGLAGLLDLGYVAFYAVGAYAYALLAENFGLSFWICLPLAGILAALDWTAQHRPDIAFVVSAAADSPFLPHDLVARLHGARLAEAADLACAASGGRSQPVIGRWAVALRDALRHALVVEDIRKIDRWTARYGMATVVWDDAPVDPFFNANTAEDLAEAERLAALYPDA